MSKSISPVSFAEPFLDTYDRVSHSRRVYMKIGSAHVFRAALSAIRSFGATTLWFGEWVASFAPSVDQLSDHRGSLYQKSHIV